MPYPGQPMPGQQPQPGYAAPAAPQQAQPMHPGAPVQPQPGQYGQPTPYGQQQPQAQQPQFAPPSPRQPSPSRLPLAGPLAGGGVLLAAIGMMFMILPPPSIDVMEGVMKTPAVAIIGAVLFGLGSIALAAGLYFLADGIAKKK